MVGPRARREVRAQAHVGAVVDLLVRDQRLRELHPDRPLHRRRRAVHRVVAPRRGAVVVELEHPVPRHPQLRRGVHQRVDPRVGRELLLGRERDLGERHGAVAAGDRHLHQPVAERAPPLLQHLADEALVGVDPLLEDHALDGLARHVAARDAGALVERPVHRRARAAQPRLHVVLEQLVVRADLARRQIDPVLVAADRTDRHRSRRLGADVDLVRHPGDPADQLLFPEDRHDRQHVGVMDVADRGVVVAEDVARADPRIVLVVLADHVLDRVRGGVDVDDDPPRQGDRVALRRVQHERQLADLLDDRRGGDIQSRLPGRHQAAAQAREDLLVADRLVALELELLEAPVVAGLGEQPLLLVEHREHRAAVPADRAAGVLLERAGCVD